MKKPFIRQRRTACAEAGQESGMGFEELAYLRANDFAPATPGENPVMAALRGCEMLLLRLGNRRAKRMRGFGLTGAGDIVELAFIGVLRFCFVFLWLFFFVFVFFCDLSLL